MTRRIWVLLVGTIGLMAPLAVAPATQTPTSVAADRPVDFNWDVRPILSENCFRCHGNDGRNRRAALRLDDPESAYAALASRPNAHAIVPGKPDESEIIKRVTADTPARRMPPAATNKVLTPAQVDILRRWIAQGATYKPHWAFIPPVKSTPPVVKASGRIGNDIDRFVFARLQRDGLAPSAEADRETLINRVTLTLTGLPPTLAEVDAFLNDKSSKAYEKVVDRLLASPAYGEHLAEYWLNLSRYAESDGFLNDSHDRLFWPYRDWVISALNKNMPFDQFATWQLAGDLLPSRTREQVLSTAFLRVGRRTTENGAIDEEYRVEYMIDRTNTVGTAFLGLTTGCARCHDHKYDPISQKDFYALGGFFNSTDEPGFYAPGGSGVTAGPTLNWTDPATDASLSAAAAAIQAKHAAYGAARAVAGREAAATVDALLRAPDQLTTTVRQSIERALVAYYPFEETAPIPDDKLPKTRPRRRPAPAPLAPETSTPPPSTLATAITSAESAAATGTAVATQGGQTGRRVPPGGSSANQELTGDQQLQLGRVNVFGSLPSDLVRDALVWSPSKVPSAGPAVLEAPILRDGVKGKAFYFDDTNRGVLGEDVGYFERTQPFSLDFWMLAAQVYDDSVVLDHRENDNSGNAGYQLDVEKNHLRFDMMHSRAGNKIRVLSKQTVPVKQWTHVTVAYDGSSRASGIALYLNGVKADLDVVGDNLTKTMIPNGGGTLGDEYLGLQFGKRFRKTPMKDGALDEIRIFNKTLTPLEVQYLQKDALPSMSPEVLRSHVVDLIVATDPRVVAAATALGEARQAQNLLISVVPEVMVMGDTPKPRPTYLLIRGQYTDHGEELTPRGLSQVFPWDDALPQNRLGLARWLFDPRNPLTARVFVNQLWQQQFGRGLVETAEDFGAQGSIPSHPELLDWLAVALRDSGWDIKNVQKLLVMSATYRQSSNASKELLERDPRNVLLAHFSRVRMPAELVRDHALAASGLLVRTIGGKSAYPYQPDTIWDGLPGYVYPALDRVPADDQHRRSMYSFIKRNAPHPAMATFDLPDRGTSTARRLTSNTPLQALVLLDDPQYLEAYRVLATHVLKEASDRDAQITRMFRLATRRRPRAEELESLRAYYDAQLRRYSEDTAAAADLVNVGVTPVDETVDTVRLAAFMNVTTVVMNTPDAYSLH